MNIKLANVIYTSHLDTIKKILDLLEYKMGKENPDFIYLKKQLFDYFYNNIKKIFIKLEQEKLIKRCPKGCSLRQGYTQCEHCNGSGYTNI